MSGIGGYFLIQVHSMKEITHKNFYIYYNHYQNIQDLMFLKFLRKPAEPVYWFNSLVIQKILISLYAQSVLPQRVSYLIMTRDNKFKK